MKFKIMKYCEGRLVVSAQPHENKKDLLVKLQGLAHLRVLTQAQYDALPESAPKQKTSCHYCGMKATSTGFFGEPVCPECGG